MTKRRPEPEPLQRGKRFHKAIQADWGQTAEGHVTIEKSITNPNGRRGRVDVFVEDESELVAVAEIKASDWDAMTEAAVRRNVRRQIRQVWSYIDSQLDAGKDVSPGIIFPGRPSSPARLETIERLFEDEGIAVVWDDESIEERRARSS